MHRCRSSSNVPRLPSFLEMLQNPHVLLTVDKVHSPLGPPRETTSERPKGVQKRSVPHSFLHFWLRNVLRAAAARNFWTVQLPKVLGHIFCFHILTSKCASRHNGVHFFDISTSKSGPNTVCLVHFDFEMCFVPCTFWLGNVLRARTACTFSSLIWPAGSAPAALASLLFDPPEPHIIGKTQCFATFLPFRAPGSSFFWDFLFLLLFSSLTLPISAFHLSILSEVWLLNFLRQYSLFI